MTTNRRAGRRLRKAAICLSLLAILGTLGCGQQRKGQPGATEADGVSLRLQWFPLAQFAGFYVAEARGFYDQADLDVRINPGGPDLNAISLVANGSDTFGIWTADQILVAKSRGVPITMVAAIYRKDPNVLMVPANSEVSGPEDFVGKTVTTVYGRATETVLLAMLERAGVSKNRVQIEPFPFNLQSFAAGDVDVSAGYVYDHPFQARQLGMEVRIIDPADYGINFYSDALFVRTELLESEPDLVERFVHASLKGWEAALANQEEAVDTVLSVTEGLDREAQEYMLEESESLIRHEHPDRIGLISRESLETMKEILSGQDLLEGELDISQAYTNRFVESYYEQ